MRLWVWSRSLQGWVKLAGLGRGPARGPVDQGGLPIVWQLHGGRASPWGFCRARLLHISARPLGDRAGMEGCQVNRILLMWSPSRVQRAVRGLALLRRAYEHVLVLAVIEGTKQPACGSSYQANVDALSLLGEMAELVAREL